MSTWKRPLCWLLRHSWFRAEALWPVQFATVCERCGRESGEA